MIRGAFLALLAAGNCAWAALPDPVRLGVAVEAGDLRAARAWLDEGMNPDTEADRVGTGLMIAAWEGNIPMMELFASRGASVNRVNRFNEQALQLAAWRGQLAAVRWLLDHGAAIRRDGEQWSAIHYAAYAGHDDIVKFLLDRGADVNARAPNQATALMMTALAGHEDVAATLLAAGADTRLANDRGDTALTWAMRYGNLRIARLVSTPEAFAQASKARPESFGTARQSIVAPSEITQILQQLRQAEAANQPTEQLRRRLAAAISRFVADAKPLDEKARKAGKQRPALLITARRNGGERAEVVGESANEGPVRTKQAWSYNEAQLSEFKRLLDQLNQAQEEGRPTAELRQAVREAYARLKQPPAPDPGRP